MINTLKYICLVLLSIVAISCNNQDTDLPGVDTTDEYGSIQLDFSGRTRATTTTISPEEAQNFLITVTQGDRVVRGPQTLGTMNMRFPVGQGYMVAAESCTEADAESSNNFWGKKRFTGQSEEFGINKGETTKASVGMSIANSAICVVIDKSLVNYFKTSCTLMITEGNRTLEWNYDNAGKGDDHDGQIAYFNVDDNGERTITYRIKANAEGNITDIENTITLKQAKMSRLKLSKASGDYTLTVTVNQDDLFIDDNESFTQDDIKSDDGATDADAGNDDFGSNNSGVDYDRYN